MRKKSARRNAISSANFDLFENLEEYSVECELPGEAELQRMFDIYNKEYFDGKLPRMKVRYSRRMLVAGGYFPEKREIRISRRYHTFFPDEVYDTLKHEMIHVIHFKHDAGFKRMARRIGASLRANEHPALRRPPRYIYICPQCLTEYPRQKRLRMASCGKCSGGKFDTRYKLILRKRLKQESGH